jgi:colanic acid biosynthesis glycosyl transferase WcaI
LAGDAGYAFRFSGGGPRMGEMRAGCEGLAGCEFGGYRSREELRMAFGRNDVGLVTQRPETVGTVVPSKVYGVMAAGRGVLYVGPAGSTVGRMIAEKGVGWRVGNGDAAGLELLLRRLRENRDEVEETGRRARAVFSRDYEKAGQVAKILGFVMGKE